MPGFPLQGLSSAADLEPVVNELSLKVPLQWMEVCSKLGTTLKRLQDIEREGYKYCYTMAFMDLKELNKFTLEAVIDALKSLGYSDIAMSLQNLPQRPANNASVEQSLSPMPFTLRHSFEPQTSLASCGRNSAFLSEGVCKHACVAHFMVIQRKDTIASMLYNMSDLNSQCVRLLALASIKK